MDQQVHCAVIGGDLRQETLARALEEKGYPVTVWGICEDDASDAWKEKVLGADAVLLPLPVTADGVHVKTLNEKLSLRFSNLLEAVPQGVVIFGGKFPTDWADAAERTGHPAVDYFTSEALQMRNAVPTAEGAIRLAAEHLSVTLQGCEVSVLGYGRIGSLLAEKLTALGAKVTVVARSPEQRLSAEVRGMSSLVLNDDFSAFPKSCRVVFNTIPYPVIDRDRMKQIPRNCLLMELASLPGGIPIQLAKEEGRPYLLASGLPGKYYPESAGKILAETLREELDRHFKK